MEQQRAISLVEMLRSIQEVGSKLLNFANDEKVISFLKSAIEIAKKVKSFLQPAIDLAKEAGKPFVASLNEMLGAGVAANFLLAACNVWQAVHCFSETAKLTQLKGKYEKFATFVDQIIAKTKTKLDAIQDLSEKVRKRVADMARVKKDEWKAFLDELWVSVRMIEIDTKECLNKISFGLKQIDEFLLLIKDADFSDKVGTIITNITTFGTTLVYIAACPPAGLAAGTISLGNMVFSLINYLGRNIERNKLKMDLKLKSSDLESIKSDLDGIQEKMANCFKSTKEFRESVSPFP